MRARLLAAAVVAAVLAGCGESAREPRLVLLYATCSLNKQFLEPYDPRVAYTPALARFAREGLVFRRHQTESGQSGTAFAALFSGTQATHHGVLRHPVRLREELFLVTEAYAEAGWDVHAWLGHAMASGALGYAQGVPTANVRSRRLEEYDRDFRRILDRLATEPDYRAFVVTNFVVTHAPYQGFARDEFCERFPGECARRGETADFERHRERYVAHHLPLSFDFDRTVRRLRLDATDVARLEEVVEILYKADVFRLDRLFGFAIEAIDARGLADESLVAFTSDHGEVHRADADFRWTHGFQLAPEVLNVALVLRGPGAGVTVGSYEAVTRSIDVFPTLAGLSGVAVPAAPGLGSDLSAAVRGEAEPPDLLAFSHTSLFPGPIHRYRHLARLFPDGRPHWLGVGVREGDRLYRWRHTGGDRWQESVYALGEDGAPTDATRDADDPASRERFAALRSYQTRLLEAYEERRTAPLPTERETELLRSLGYIE